MLWGVLDGRLAMASGGVGGLRYDMPVARALNLAYWTSIEWSDKKQRDELDSYCSVTADELAGFQQDQREQRMVLLQEFGEVVR